MQNLNKQRDKTVVLSLRFCKVGQDFDTLQWHNLGIRYAIPHTRHYYSMRNFAQIPC